MGGKKQIRANSKIAQLPEDIRGQLDSMLLDTSNTYVELSKWLKCQGYKISKSSVGRYALRTNLAAQRLLETLEKTRAIVKAVETNPELDYTKASRILMMDGLLQKVSTAEEEFQEMPLDKAGRLIASLSRTEVYNQKARREYKTKMETALDGLETELMEALRGDAGLARELAEIMKKARERIEPHD